MTTKVIVMNDGPQAVKVEQLLIGENALSAAQPAIDLHAGEFHAAYVHAGQMISITESE